MDPRALPIPDPDGQPYYDGLRQGRLLLKHCTACDRPHFYPRELCPHCHSDALDWVPASGEAEVYSYTVVRRPPPHMEGRAPYVVAIVTLKEGPRMMTHVVGCAPEAVHVGQAVVVDFAKVTDEFTLPVFRPRD